MKTQKDKLKFGDYVLIFVFISILVTPLIISLDVADRQNQRQKIEQTCVGPSFADKPLNEDLQGVWFNIETTSTEEIQEQLEMTNEKLNNVYVYLQCLHEGNK